MKSRIIKNKSIVILAFTIFLVSGYLTGCKKTAKKDNQPAAIVSGTFSITLAETTTDSGKTWKPQNVDCLASGVFTFNDASVLVYKKSACQGDGDFTGTWTYDATSKEFLINTAVNGNWWDGIIKNVTDKSFVLDESAIPNAQFNDRVTFTKK